MTATQWADRAACIDMPTSSFFPEELSLHARRIAVASAFATCARCPVAVECLHTALVNDEFDHGIWGGLDAAERRRLSGIPVPTGRRAAMLDLRRFTGRRSAA